MQDLAGMQDLTMMQYMELQLVAENESRARIREGQRGQVSLKEAPLKKGQVCWNCRKAGHKRGECPEQLGKEEEKREEKEVRKRATPQSKAAAVSLVKAGKVKPPQSKAAAVRLVRAQKFQPGALAFKSQRITLKNGDCGK